MTVPYILYIEEANDLPGSDAILGELRELYETHGDDLAVQEALASGLHDSHWYAAQAGDQPRSDALLGELRGLYKTHSDNPTVRKALARGLVSASYSAGEAGDLPRRDALLDELRDLIAAHPDDPNLAEIGKAESPETGSPPADESQADKPDEDN